MNFNFGNSMDVASSIWYIRAYRNLSLLFCVSKAPFKIVQTDFGKTVLFGNVNRMCTKHTFDEMAEKINDNIG